MVEVFLKTLPFFAIVGLGYWAARAQFFTEIATSYLTKFVFYFALPAMIIRFSSNLSFYELVNVPFIASYLCASFFVYFLVTGISMLRSLDMAEAAVEAQCACIGNVGFLGIPMLAMLMGEAAVVWVMLVLSMDLLVFGSLLVILIVGSRDGRMTLDVLKSVGLGLIRNPMLMAMVAGLLWSSSGKPMPMPAAEFFDILGAAATPGALFAIGASLASKSAERLTTAGWLAFCKLFLHPIAVAIAALLVFPVAPYPAAVMIAAAALPVAGNIFIVATHYNVAPKRVSASIFISTVASVFTVSIVIAWVTKLYA
ncbi:MAG: AEC family transporter [Planktomarina sp.]|nr:AEC family transporter [Planktomarina sp.]MDT2032516.1 AEC family transporter [Planktomarina sp.]MDT2039002.1 AEC family transporter [Planktomarina sp.]MDT2048815.1 AEC family transporter [Planktomarina sp.]|tara:strand:+ start:1151 stop:2086 length:936 start_codon:yes stop_codon:yes gene_type:complete